MAVWPFLIFLAIAATPLLKLCGSPGNWRAAFVFASAIILVRIVLAFNQLQPIVAISLIYAVMAAFSLAFFDKVAAVFLGLIGLIIISELLGVLPRYPRQIIGEVVFCAGVLCCAIIGPTGGLLASNSIGGSNRHIDNLAGVALFGVAVEKD